MNKKPFCKSTNFSKQLNTKMTTAYHIGNPGSGFGHAQKYGWA
jgi:hypothetical protein